MLLKGCLTFGFCFVPDICLIFEVVIQNRLFPNETYYNITLNLTKLLQNKAFT